MESLYVWRKASGMTGDQICQRVSSTRNGTMIPPAQWFRVEKRNRIPHHRHLQRYCKALGISYADLFGVQAIIEELISMMGTIDIKKNWEAALTEYANRTHQSYKTLLCREPGPIQFEVKKV